MFAQLTGEHALLARLLYGTGLRITEALQLRVKDLDFANRALVVRSGKGGKDRIVMLPQSLLVELRAHSNASTRGRVCRGPGSGCFRKTTTRPTLAAGSCDAIISTTKPSSAPSSGR